MEDVGCGQASPGPCQYTRHHQDHVNEQNFTPVQDTDTCGHGFDWSVIFKSTVVADDGRKERREKVTVLWSLTSAFLVPRMTATS